jgi:hypothetical protein
LTNWNDGYVVDIAYTYGYYPGMNPARLPLAFAFHGLRRRPSRPPANWVSGRACRPTFTRQRPPRTLVGQ